jgi:hypothetical protein
MQGDPTSVQRRARMAEGTNPAAILLEALTEVAVELASSVN